MELRLSCLVVAIAFFLKCSGAIVNSAEVLQEPKLEPPREAGYFGWEDYAVLGTMLIVSCVIGVIYGYCGDSQTTSDDFLLGGSSMGTFPTALSLAASFVTAIELLGNPAEMYNYGVQFWVICAAFVLVIPPTSWIFLPVYMRLRLTSSYEYLELRFGRMARCLAAVLYLIQTVFYAAVAVYAPALALADATGLNVYLAVTLVYVVCIFYASQGGMKAVIMTDTFQAVVLILSLALVLGIGIIREGGMEAVWEYSRNTNRLNALNVDADPTVRHTLWSVTIGGTFYWMGMFCANQATIQKYLAVEKLSQARVALVVSSVGLILIYTTNFLTGMVLAKHYQHCDPLDSGQIVASDRLLPLYVITELGQMRGVPGLFVAGIFAASLGTVASALNSLAAVTCQDFLAAFGVMLEESKGAKAARWISIIFGIVSFALVFLVEKLGSVLQLALSFNGMVGGVVLGLFSLGLLFPWANCKGAMSGAIIGLAVVLWSGFGAQLAQANGYSVDIRLPASTDGCTNMTLVTRFFEDETPIFWLYRISYLWYSLIGCMITVIIGALVSMVTQPSSPPAIPVDLLAPCIVSILHKLPDSVKQKLKVPRKLSAFGAVQRPMCFVEGKDAQRRRRLSEMSGGVFYSGPHPAPLPNNGQISTITTISETSRL